MSGYGVEVSDYAPREQVVSLGAWRHRFEATGGREPTAGRVLVVAVRP